MTNAIALWLGAFVLAALALDYLMFDQANLFFLARKGLELMEWLAFWR